MIDKNLLEKFNILLDDKKNRLYKITEDEEGKKRQNIILEPIPEVIEFFIDGEPEKREIKLKLGNETIKTTYGDLFKYSHWEKLFLEERLKITTKSDIKDMLYILINSYKENWKKEIKFIGIQENKLLLPGTTIDENLNRIKNGFYTKNNTLEIEIPSEKLTTEEKEALKNILPKFRGLEGVAWFVACYFNHDKINFPILSSFGTTGKGKSFGMDVLKNITFTGSKIPCRTLTTAQLKRHLDITDLMPLIVDDYKRAEKYNFDVEAMIRALYEGDKNYQATTSKEMIEFQFRRPVAITGENPLVNISSNNRMIELEIKNLDSRNLNILLKNDCEILKKLGLEILEERLKLNNDDVYELYNYNLMEFRKKFEHLNIEERILRNYSIIDLGLKSIDKILGTDWNKKYNYEKQFVQGIKTFEQELEEVIKTVTEAGIYQKEEFIENHFVQNERILKFHTSFFFENIILDLKRRNIISIEEMNLKDFREKLKSCKNIELKKSLKINGKTNVGFIFKPSNEFWEHIEEITKR